MTIFWNMINKTIFIQYKKKTTFYSQISKLVLDEYFTSSEFISGVEAGAEFGLMNSPSNASITTQTSNIPLSHQLNSTSPFVDSGVDLNHYSNYNASIDNEDEVFIVEKNGMFNREF